MEKQTLGQFILTEMTRRQMSAYEFAKLVGVSHSVINKFLNHGIRERYAGKRVGEPSVTFLIKLSKATGVDVCSLVALVHPDGKDIDARARLIAQRIAALPLERQAIIDAYLMGLNLIPTDKDT